MVVLKFGGSSVRNAEWIERCLDVSRSRLAEAPLVVSSAMGKTTDAILALIDDVERGRPLDVRLAELRSLHEQSLASVSAALDEAERTAWRTRLADLLAAFAEELEAAPPVDPPRRDSLLSYGERLATAILAAGCAARGIEATLLDSRELIRTDAIFGAARPDFQETRRRVREAVSPRVDHMYIAQGFIGSAADGRTTTLGRGGSDFSATIFGAALDAQRVEIWTDVDGILTSDPRLIPDARTIPEVSYNEAAELAYFGARVVHPSTIIPAVERSIPVIVCNTGNPDGPTTTIHARPSDSAVRAVAGRRGVTIITVHSSRMLNAWGFLSQMFAAFEQYRVSVDLVATSEVSVSVSVDLAEVPAALVASLEALGRVTIHTDRAVISIVGEGLWRDAALIRAVFAALEAEPPVPPVEMISLGSSDTNLSLVVPRNHYETAMRALHDRFFASGRS